MIRPHSVSHRLEACATRTTQRVAQASCLWRHCSAKCCRRRPRNRSPWRRLVEWRPDLTWLTGRSRRAQRNRFIVLGGVALVLAVAVVVSIVQTSRREQRWRILAARHAAANGLEPALVIAVIRAESAGNRWAVSRAGARGLMQLMPATAREVAQNNRISYSGPDDLFDADLNIQLGTLYLAWLRKFFRDDRWLYVAAYNAGPGAVGRLRKANPELSSEQLIRQRAPAETRAYVPTVFRYWRQEAPQP
ncbi:MAG: lytic transglycosylase domain-containing protein [Planctomycetes bacterium]|nr:lytic transglycosylase domain-containing protein [Planctomycetota bacterium]